MARAIEATSVPNYRIARFPVHLNLNINAWRHHLKGYHSKHLIQYLTFGFPLSLSNSSSPNSANHHSAIQFGSAVSDYLAKEIALGAILGPFDEIAHPPFHCSPLLTRPKDYNKRRVILNLSYPTGASLNDAVTRDLFDGKSFHLRFPTIDDIVDKIRHTEGTVMLSKIDVARAFRNLKVDPFDLAFGWIHGSSSFQMTSEAILVYIDDFIMVASHVKLPDLFKELGLPMNPDKMCPLPEFLHVFASPLI